MKVDIFYQELSYEEIEQNIAFEFLSLLSEVGGFLGLLLGASVLTVFELVDYISLSFLNKLQVERRMNARPVDWEKTFHSVDSEMSFWVIKSRIQLTKDVLQSFYVLLKISNGHLFNKYICRMEIWRLWYKLFQYFIFVCCGGFDTFENIVNVESLF